MMLQKLLHKAGLRHSDVAEHIGVSASAVGHYCTGRRLLDYKAAIEVSEVLASHERGSQKIASLARSMVAAAIKSGVLPSLKAGDVACADCGAVADRYDHRNYARPLEVDPVCATCNQLRGAGRIEIDTMDVLHGRAA